jgi:hypothetical protein
MTIQTWIYNSKTNQLYNSDTGTRFVLSEGSAMANPQQKCEVIFVSPTVGLADGTYIDFTDVLYQSSRQECEKYLRYLAEVKHTVDIQRLITKTKLGV